MPTQTSKIRNSATNTATSTIFGKHSWNVSRKTMVCCIDPYQLSRYHGSHLFKSRFDNFNINLLKNAFSFSALPFKCLG